MPELNMPALLERAGFKLRGKNRADCARCTGHSRATVGFTDKVAHCFRCDWRANIVTLARELGLLSGESATRASLHAEAQRRAQLEQPLRAFESWREAQIRKISDQYYALSRAALRAAAVLRIVHECEPAWDALARFYHAEARLSAAFDFLMFAKASAWLETDSTPAGVFHLWRQRAA